MTDRYQIIRLITKNQMGGVYLAQDTELDREVTFHHLEPGYEAEPATDWETTFTQFAAKLKALQHPNIRPIYDGSVEDGDAIIISQFLEGETISDCIKKEAFSVKDTINMALDLLAAMQAIHSMGIYHGAMHTGSVMCFPLPQGGFHYILADLGLKRLSSIVTGEETHLEDPILIPPELYAQTDTAPPQSDLFMIGQLCYTVLAGGHPFADLSPKQCARQYRSGKMPPLRKFNPDVPEYFTSWITGMIASNPKRRPTSATEALKELQIIAVKKPEKKNHPTKNGPPIPPSTPPKKSRGLWLASLCLLVIMIGGFFFISQNKEKSTSSTSDTTAHNQSANQKEPTQKKNTSPQPVTPIKKTDTTQYLKPGPDTIQIIRSAKITPLKSMERKKRVFISNEQFLDWAILQKKDFITKTKSPYTLNLSKLSRLQGSPYSPKLIDFRVSTNKKAETISSIAPQMIHSQKNQPQEWEVTFRAHNSHNGPLEVIFYITQQSCTLSFVVTDPNKGKTLLESRSKGPGVVEVVLSFAHVIPNKLYSLQVTATPTLANKTYITGLHAVFLKKPPEKPKAITKKQPPPKKKKSPVAAKPPISPLPAGFIPILQPYSPDNHFNSKEWFHAEGSILKVGDNQYCLFYSRWPKNKSVIARITHPEIAIATSKSSSGPWKYWKTALKGRKNHWDKFGISHPIIKQFDGEYYLYYVSTTADINAKQLEVAAKLGGKDPNWKTLNKNRKIGVAHSSSYKGPWKRLGKPIIEAKKPFTGFSCSPSVTLSPDGQYLMMVCSLSEKGKIVSYIAQSPKPHFPTPTIKTAIEGEGFSLWYQPSTKAYQFIFNGDAKYFYFIHSLNLTKWYKRGLPKPKQLPPSSPVPTQSFHSPQLFINDNHVPEVFIFHSDDINNGGIFTIPFKK